MAQSGMVRLMQKPMIVVREGLAGRLDAPRLDNFAVPDSKPRRRGFVRTMLLASAMAAGGILAVAAVMTLGAL
jgi:hypothetical protein